MTPYDISMIAVVVAGMIWGAWRGITWQLASILSLALGYGVAVPTSSQIAPHFPGQPIVARGLAMLALYVAVSVGIFAVAWSVRATLRRWKFEAYDRHLGMILGGLEGAMLGVVATLFIISFAPQSRVPILTSRAGIIVDQTLKAAEPALPAEVRKMLAPFWEVLENGDPTEAPAPDHDVPDQPERRLATNEDQPKIDQELIRSVTSRWLDRVIEPAPTESIEPAPEPEPEPEPVASIDPRVILEAFDRGGPEAIQALADSFEDIDPKLIRKVFKRDRAEAVRLLLERFRNQNVAKADGNIERNPPRR